MGARRITRRLGWTRNPLRRTSDRIEAWATFVAIMTMLLVAPWAAWMVGRATYREDVRATTWERQHDVQVTAVLAEDAPEDPAAGTRAAPAPQFVSTRASWVGPDGVSRTGNVAADPGARAGSTVALWVDQHGAVVPTPGRRHPLPDAIASSLLAVCLLAAGLGGLHRIVVLPLNRRRLRSWQAEWRIVEPRWSDR